MALTVFTRGGGTYPGYLAVQRYPAVQYLLWVLWYFVILWYSAISSKAQWCGCLLKFRVCLLAQPRKIDAFNPRFPSKVIEIG
jgi:hypothetical protein